MPEPNDKVPPQTPAPPTLEELLAQNATPEGRAKTAAMFGVKDQPDEIIDVFEPGDTEGRQLHDDAVAHFGGPEGFTAASADFTEAIELLDPEREFGKAVEKMTRSEESEAVKQIVAEWRAILGNPEKAQALLSQIYSNPTEEPGRSYFAGRASDAVNNAVARLWQAAHGEPVTGRPRSQGDGFVR